MHRMGSRKRAYFIPVHSLTLHHYQIVWVSLELGMLCAESAVMCNITPYYRSCSVPSGGAARERGRLPFTGSASALVSAS